MMKFAVYITAEAEKDIGVLASLHDDKPCFTELKRYNLSVCQLVSWNPAIWTAQLAEQQVRDILETIKYLQELQEKS